MLKNTNLFSTRRAHVLRRKHTGNFVPFSVSSSLTNSTLSFPYRNRNEIANFGPAAGVVDTRLGLRATPERTPCSYTLDPLFHSAVVLWLTHVIVSVSALMKPEGWPCVELQKELEWDCVGGTSCAFRPASLPCYTPQCTYHVLWYIPLLYTTVHLSSVMIYFSLLNQRRGPPPGFSFNALYVDTWFEMGPR